MSQHEADIEQPEPVWELRFGIALSIFAALLAINDLGAGKFGDDEIKAINEKASSYLWYQSKGIKESLAEGQRDLIETILKAGSVHADKQAGLEKISTKLDQQIARYKKEKKEILLGSAVVGEENWVQDIDGHMGQVIGSKQREEQVQKLASAGDVFDFATLFLQLCLVIGAIGLLLKQPKARNLAFTIVVTLGILGSSLCGVGYIIALS